MIWNSAKRDKLTGRPRRAPLVPVQTGTTCRRCKRTFPRDIKHFNASKYTRDGLDHRCADCTRASRQKSYAIHKETSRLLTQTLKGRFSKIRNGARQRNLSWSLTLEDLSQFWQQPCTYCGVALETVGLDRVDSRLGYEMGNVVACCSMCNTMKHEYSLESWLAQMQRIMNNFPTPSPTIKPPIPHPSWESRLPKPATPTYLPTTTITRNHAN
jgi:hypothetical protein